MKLNEKRIGRNTTLINAQNSNTFMQPKIKKLRTKIEIKVRYKYDA